MFEGYGTNENLRDVHNALYEETGSSNGCYDQGNLSKISTRCLNEVTTFDNTGLSQAYETPVPPQAFDDGNN